MIMRFTLVLAALSFISLLGSCATLMVIWNSTVIDPVFWVDASWFVLPSSLCGLGYGFSSFSDIRRQLKS